MTLQFKRATPTGLKTIYIESTNVSSGKLLEYYEPKKVWQACESGCPNYNMKWCCPPLSDTLDNIIKPYSHAIITYCYINISDMVNIKREYQKIRAANAILKSYSRKSALRLENELNGLALLDGSCGLCKPCNRKKGLQCKRPNVMRFSMESTGINVVQLLKNVENFELKWYKNGIAPSYTSVVSCVLYTPQ